ncbi:MAG: hypothetical protein HY611_03305 [Elusimicrobia bacterium]|nr:hypothetical protein [Elusimicrobiota bacterium]
MAWSNSHLHMFHVGKTRYAPRMPDWDDVPDERKVILRDIAPEAGFKGPECLAGANKAPGRKRT